MKLIFITFIFHFLCIIIFSICYYKLHDKIDNKKPFLDYFLLSTTIQAGVGISNLGHPSVYGKITMIIQQLIMLLTNIITFYVFLI